MFVSTIVVPISMRMDYLTLLHVFCLLNAFADFGFVCQSGLG
jgi:hypothetical protein